MVRQSRTNQISIVVQLHSTAQLVRTETRKTIRTLVSTSLSLSLDEID